MERKPEPDDETRLNPLETRTAGADAASPAPTALPDSIGEYRVLRKLGEGGMGVVYEAEQASLHRRVALKVIRGGAAADEHRLRMFEREAETLARLKHTNIGAIYETGRSADGQPYLVMEKVEGQPLDHYLQGRGEATDRKEIEFRIRLFLRLCAAVGYAHQRGVIHRDLKPANVMVDAADEDPRSALKVLDFGLARIIDDDSPSATMATAVGTIKGTLYYMSPEQARGETDAIDVRTDVYALGVILFEMLTGGRPLDFAGRSLVDVVRTICEETPRSLRQAWSGPQRPDEDLETILGKALAKDVERRYSSVAALADDIERYLSSRPILAQPPSSVYLLKKFARRNRALVGGVAATVVMLVVGVIVSTMFAVGEARERRQAEAARDDLQAVVTFQSNMIGEVDPELAGQQILRALRDRIAAGDPSQESLEQLLAALDRAVRGVNPTDLARDVLGQNILEPAAAAAASGFTEKPLIEARLQQSIASTYRGLGLYDAALPHAERAVELLLRELGEAHTSTLSAESVLSQLHWSRGDKELAERHFIDLVRRASETLGPDDPDTLVLRADLAGLRWSLGRAEAEAEYLEILSARRAAIETADTATASVLKSLGVIYYQQGRYDEALSMWNEALEVFRDNVGPDSADTLNVMTSLAGLHQVRGDLDRAQTLFDEALSIQRRVLGDEDPRTLATRSSLGNLYQAQGETERAIALHRQTLTSRLQVGGRSHPATLRSMNNLAMSLMRAREYDEARLLLEELVMLDAQIKAGGADPAIHLHSLGELYLAIDELPSAESQLLRALKLYESLKHKYAGLALYQLGGVAARQGRRGDALSYLERALDRGYRKWKADAPEFASLRGDAGFDALVARAAAQ